MGALTAWHLVLLSSCAAASLTLLGLAVYAAVRLGRRGAGGGRPGVR